MERSIYSNLKKWKESLTRKPLILQGARQVGKTYILKEFGAREYSEVVYINCDDNNDMQNMFVDYDVDRIIRSLSAISGVSIKPSTTLLIIDEIQEVERGLASLKYFCEKAPEYHVAVAGSLLGITLHEGTSFPVGKVDMLYMYPMDFEEFLLAMGKEQLVELLRSNSWAALTPLRGMLTELLRQYYFVGGMPEAVKAYVERGDIWEVRSIHSKIIDAYRNDMSKHAPKQQVQRINMVWNSIPSQLARDNKKFIYGALRKGARANDFEIAIQWLVDSGLVHKVHRISKPVVPLKFYEDMSSFKLFLLDCGLLGALSETPPEQILSNDNSTLEIDFVVQHDTHIIPIEVKAEENLRAKSLRQFVTDNPGLHGVRFSMSDYREQDWLTNVPLWAVKWAF